MPDCILACESLNSLRIYERVRKGREQIGQTSPLPARTLYLIVKRYHQPPVDLGRFADAGL